jgi:signal transduction histidine kinase
MTRIIDQLLDLTRARLGGTIPLARCPTRLLPLVKSLLEALVISHPGCRFELVTPADLKGGGDSDRIAQVLANVLSNAAQFGMEGAPIKVGLSSSEGTAKITIHNELRGNPIPVEVLVTLFEPYRRGWDREHVGTGLGLGLYIAHEIVRVHRGTITVESLRSGTTFEISLPEAIQ